MCIAASPHPTCRLVTYSTKLATPSATPLLCYRVMCQLRLFMICCFTATTSAVIAYPGQDAELMCTVTPSGNQTAAWIINGAVHTLQQIYHGIVNGYGSNGNNLVVQSIRMHDGRNGTEYNCVTVPSTVSNPTIADIEDESDATTLYVAGE